MPTEMQLPQDHPMLVAWESYKKTPEYANSAKWAKVPEHTDGSMWAAFSAGWQHNKTPAPSSLEVIGRKILAILKHPHQSVTYVEMDELENAIEEIDRK